MPCHGANWLQPWVNEHTHVNSSYYSGAISTVMPRTIAIGTFCYMYRCTCPCQSCNATCRSRPDVMMSHSWLSGTSVPCSSFIRRSHCSCALPKGFTVKTGSMRLMMGAI